MTAALYLSATEVADRLGITVASFTTHRHQPPPDAIIGATTGRPVKGWLPQTVDTWKANR